MNCIHTNRVPKNVTAINSTDSFYYLVSPITIKLDTILREAFANVFSPSLSLSARVRLRMHLSNHRHYRHIHNNEKWSKFHIGHSIDYCGVNLAIVAVYIWKWIFEFCSRCYCYCDYGCIHSHPQSCVYRESIEMISIGLNDRKEEEEIKLYSSNSTTI